MRSFSSSAAPRTTLARRSRRSSAGTALVVATSIAVPQAAHVAHASTAAAYEPDAREDPQRERAMEAFRRGTQAYDEARYEDALVAFQDAATLYASPDFQYNIGLCYEKLDKVEEAIRAFETYLRTKADPPDRANVEDRIARLRSLQQRASSTSGSEPQPAQPIDTAPRDEPGKPPSKGLIIAGGTLAGVGAGMALGGGIAFGVLAKGRSDELSEIQQGGNPEGATFADARALESDGKRFEALQVTFAAVGAAVALTGVALLAVGLKRRKRTADTATHLIPAIGARHAGLSLVGRF